MQSADAKETVSNATTKADETKVAAQEKDTKPQAETKPAETQKDATPPAATQQHQGVSANSVSL
ncbi:hypothetical protein Mapa_013815 [Marchantia paleacea]|nr:hypothetical protein Mapa_013815 [Marchantia paleacea]